MLQGEPREKNIPYNRGEMCLYASLLVFRYINPAGLYKHVSILMFVTRRTKVWQMKWSVVYVDSILKTISHMIGPSEDYTYFNTDLIVHINAAFARLCTLGVGPETPFMITGPEETWDDIGIAPGYMENLKQYVYLKVRYSFDPPSNTVLVEAIDKQIKELEWLMNSVAEIGY